METRRMILAVAAALAVYTAYMFIYTKYFAPKANPQENAPGVVDHAPAGAQPAQPATSTAPGTAPSLTPAPAAGDSLQIVGGDSAEPVTIGGGDALVQLTLNPRGAGLRSLELTSKLKSGRYRHRQGIRNDDPYTLIDADNAGAGVLEPLSTRRIWVDPYGGDKAWRLDGVTWRLVERTDRRAAFEVTLFDPGAERTLVRVRKTFEIVEGRSLFYVRLDARNEADEPVSVGYEQIGPCGLIRESSMYDMRLLMAGWGSGDGITIEQRRKGSKSEAPLVSLENQSKFIWAAVANRYFVTFMRPVAADGNTASFVQRVDGPDAAPDDKKAFSLYPVLTTARRPVPAGGRDEVVFELFAGSKLDDDLEAANPAFVTAQLDYSAARSADNRCCCTFAFLTTLMIGLLEGVHTFVRNYGVAIIVLVIIVRTLLHPLAVYQQKSMYRMQESMGKLQPKLNEIKEKYANNKVEQQQAMMRLYAEEGVNPMAGVVGMIPMFIQMPLLVALWTALNTDVNLRHAGFDGWWIRDLAAPDHFVEFSSPVTIPVLGWLPIVGYAFQQIPSINLLPILMGVSMWLQQKYMPKPHIEARKEGAKHAPGPGGMDPEQQLRQQQMIANMMSVMMPVMFYYMPSGLTLYWMATNVFGIVESLIIRKQLREEKARRAAAGPIVQRPKKEGLMGRIFKRLADQAADLQKKADEMGEADKKRHIEKERQRRKGNRA